MENARAARSFMLPLGGMVNIFSYIGKTRSEKNTFDQIFNADDS